MNEKGRTIHIKEYSAHTVLWEQSQELLTLLESSAGKVVYTQRTIASSSRGCPALVTVVVTHLCLLLTIMN